MPRILLWGGGSCGGSSQDLQVANSYILSGIDFGPQDRRPRVVSLPNDHFIAVIAGGLGLPTEPYLGPHRVV